MSAHLKEAGEEQGKVLHELLLVVRAPLVRFGEVDGGRYDGLQLRHKDAEEGLKVCVELRTDDQGPNLHRGGDGEEVE